MHIIVDGILTNYQIIGNKPKTILILHGWKKSLTEWLPTAKKLSNKYKVVLLDLPGFGGTNRPESTLDIYGYATFVEHFLDKLDIDHCTFIGHSFGGRIGIILGAKTKKIDKLILVDAAGVEKRSMIAKTKITFFKVVKKFLPKRIIEKLRLVLGSPDYKTAGNMRDIFIKVINEDLTYLLPKISVPALLIWGDKDTEVEIWKTKLMRSLIPSAKLRVLWGTGHSPYLEKPNEFMDILQEYL